MSNFYEQDFKELFGGNEVDTEAFIQKIKEYVPLFEEIAKQMGYSDIYNDKDDLIGVLQEMDNIYRHGCNSGISGFIYYDETEKFFDENSSEIIESHKDMADSLGESFDEMVSNFQNGGDYIIDLLEGGNRLKNDLVFGYLENKVSCLFDSDFEEFEDCFTEKKYELTPEQEKEGYRIEDGYLYDKNNNSWSLEIHSIEEAIKLSGTLVDCQNCRNCENCRNCKDCRGCYSCQDCKGCWHCFDCKGCRNCEDCDGCRECNECRNCKNCNECEDCYGCRKCECCEACIQCDGCIDCRNCGTSNNLKNCDGYCNNEEEECVDDEDNNTRTMQ